MTLSNKEKKKKKMMTATIYECKIIDTNLAFWWGVNESEHAAQGMGLILNNSVKNHVERNEG